METGRDKRRGLLFSRTASGQKPADDFLHEEGQIRLGKRQTRRQAKKSFHAKPQKLRKIMVAR
jgi:hypothetical protein